MLTGGYADAERLTDCFLLGEEAHQRQQEQDSIMVGTCCKESVIKNLLFSGDCVPIHITYLSRIYEAPVLCQVLDGAW